MIYFFVNQITSVWKHEHRIVSYPTLFVLFSFLPPPFFFFFFPLNQAIATRARVSPILPSPQHSNWKVNFINFQVSRCFDEKQRVLVERGRFEEQKSEEQSRENGNLAVERTRDRTLRRKQGKGGKSLRRVEQQVTRQETERRTHHVLRVSSSFSPSFLRLPLVFFFFFFFFNLCVWSRD